MHKRASLLVILLLSVLVACSGGDAASDDQLVEPANVSAVEVRFEDDGFVAIASGFLSDSCTTLHESTQTISNNRIEIALTTTRPADEMCAQVIEEFSEPIPIDMTELPNGEYMVTVNGVAAVEPVVIGDEQMP